MPQLRKICSKCKNPKPISKFDEAKTGKYGVRGDCKICRRIESRKQSENYFQIHKSEVLKKSNERHIKQRRNLDRQYVLYLLVKHLRCKRSEISEELIAFKSEAIAFQRLFNQLKTKAYGDHRNRNKRIEAAIKRFR